jgi:predicted nucleic acid-binding protein
VTHYVDSSALVPVYIPESFSKAARKAVTEAGQIPFTQLHQLEVLNAFELLVGRRVITRDECHAILEQLHEDLDAQRLMVRPLDLNLVFARAGELSKRHTATCLTRSLDLLHVAAAHVASCTTFVSADDRQLTAAKLSGLSVIDIKKARRLSRRDLRRDP